MSAIRVKSLIALLLVAAVTTLFGYTLWQGWRASQQRVQALNTPEHAAPPVAVTAAMAPTGAASVARTAPKQEAPQRERGPKKLSAAPSSPSLTKFSSNEAARAGLSMRIAEYWDSMGKNRVRCRLCPRHCVIPDGYRGACRARINIGGTLRTLVYGRAVAIHVDPIEKKPLFHFLPKTKALSIATAGCNLRCIFCQNWEISQAYPEKARFMMLSPREVVDAALRSGSESIAYTYTEPTIFFEYMRDTARLAHKAGLKNVWITCGYIEEEPLRELCKYIDAANVDLKGFSNKFYREYTSGTVEPVLQTFRILKEEGVWTELTNLVIPGANDSPQDISNLCAWVVEKIGTDMPVHFSRFHPNYRVLDRPPTPVSTLNMAVDIAKGFGIKYVYMGNVAGSKWESTYCPKCGKKLISRMGYYISGVNIKNGKCEYCGEPIAGRWK